MTDSPPAPLSLAAIGEFSLYLKYIAPLHTTGKWLLLSVVVGAVAGLGVIVFDIASQSVRHFTVLEEIVGYAPPDPAGESRLFAVPKREFSPWKLIGVISVGGLLAGWFVLHLHLRRRVTAQMPPSRPFTASGDTFGR